MTSRHQTLTLFLTSLVISLGWYAYDSRDFTLMLDRLLIGAAAGYAIAWAVNSRQPTSATDDVRNRARGLAPLRAWTWWNTLLFFVLVYASSIVATVRYQHTRGEYALELGGHALALVVIGAAAWRLTGKRPLLALHLPLACGSLLLAVELHRTTTRPPPNQSVVLAPVMGLPFVCYNGGNGRLINNHFGLPQRRYLATFVPGEHPFRPPGGSDPARRDAATIGTPVLSPVHGTVVGVVSHLPDLDPDQSDPSHPAGNHICIQFGPARFLYLANLSQHSVLPAIGDTVDPGQLVARLGKNGSFSESALIVLVVTNPNVILSDTVSLPFYFSGMETADHDHANATTNAADGPLIFPQRNAILHPLILPLAPFWQTPATATP